MKNNINNINNQKHKNTTENTVKKITRTPYHELGNGSPVVPEWAQHRSVYRSAGRTLYRVETDSIDGARRDLATLSSRGWDVRIDRAAGSAANISLSRKAA